MSNILYFKAADLNFIDYLISELDKITLREVILYLTRLENDL